MWTDNPNPVISFRDRRPPTKSPVRQGKQVTFPPYTTPIVVRKSPLQRPTVADSLPNRFLRLDRRSSRLSSALGPDDRAGPIPPQPANAEHVQTHVTSTLHVPQVANMSRTCADCHRDLPQSSYTANQYSKPVHLSRCAACVHGHHSDTPSAQHSDSGRYNQADEAVFKYDDLNNPFAQGAFRWVAKARYSSGHRNGQVCVIKWFKAEAAYSKDYFTLDIKAVDKALEIVNHFNQLNVVGKAIKFNVPAVWTLTPDCKASWAGQKVLVEPFIQNYQKFNSNSGWVDEETGWPEVMQALSHFSYHLTGGMFVLCDLQGGVYQREVVLSDPVILSRTRQYGVTDLGPVGISSFFSNHDCNQYCRPNWNLPANPVRIFRPVPGTTMLQHTAPTAGSRPAGTRLY